MRLRRLLTLVGLATLTLGSAAETSAAQRSLREIVREISKERDEARPELFAELSALGSRASFDALRKATAKLKDDDLRRAAYLAVIAYGDDEALGSDGRAYLVDETRTGKEAAWRLAALDALFGFGDAALADFDALSHDHPDAEGRTRVTDALLLRLDARDDLLGLRTILANASLVQDAGIPYMGAPPERVAAAAGKTHRAIVRELLGRRLTNPTLPLFAERLLGPDASRVWKLVLLRLVAAHPGREAAGLLERSTLDDDVAVALLAIDLFVGRSPAPTREAALRRLLRSPEAALRRAAVLGLGEVLAPDAAWGAELLELAQSRDAAVRMGAAGALVRSPTPEALEALHALVQDPEWTVRAEALWRVAERRAKPSIPLLVERLALETGRLTEDVRAALVRVTRIDLGAGPATWATWWSNEGERFEVPPPDAREVVDEGVEREEGRTVARSFYRVRVLSERVAFVLDVSGSMRNRSERSTGTIEVSRMDVAKEELSNVLRGLPDGTLFNIIFFESLIKPLERKLVEMKKSTRARALRFVRDQYALGATALYPALELAYDDPLVDTIYLLSDGAPTEGEMTDIEEIRAEVARWNATRRVRIHGIAMGEDSTLLRWLCGDTGGTYIRVD